MASRSHPEPYDFLVAAGAIDRLDARSRELLRTTATLSSLSRLNGTYRNLDPAFRADMRTALGCKTDLDVKRTFETISEHCARLEALAEPDRVVLRRRFSSLAHYWPEKPEAVLSLP